MSGPSESEREVLYPVVRKNVGAYMKVEQLIAQREAAAVAAFKASAATALDRKATEWAEEFAETDSDADYGRWDAWVNAARIVRNHPT